MKVSKHALAVVAFLLTLFLVVTYGTVLFERHTYCDLKYRQNEVSCSHASVNPFLIWNREVSSEHYKGIGRPDFPFDPNPAKLGVHAYPPWHTTFFWFYGWLSRDFLLALMTGIYLVCCALFALYLNRWAPASPVNRWNYFTILFLGIGTAVAGCFGCGNYGCLLLLFSIILHWAQIRGWTLVAAIVWALLMIKPQVGVLFFWPFFWNRQYRTILLAMTICLAATLWPAYVYHTSPIELILQVPMIGKPYIGDNAATLVGMARKVLGPVGTPLWMGGCFVVCGVLSFLLRKSPSWAVKLLPPVLIFPIWTYAQGHDLTLHWPFYFLLAESLFGRGPYTWSANELKWLKVALCYLLFSAIPMIVWDFSTQLRWFDPSGLGWIYRLTSYSRLLVLCLTTLCFVKKSRVTTTLRSPEWESNPF